MQPWLAAPELSNSKRAKSSLVIVERTTWPTWSSRNPSANPIEVVQEQQAGTLSQAPERTPAISITSETDSKRRLDSSANRLQKVTEEGAPEAPGDNQEVEAAVLSEALPEAGAVEDGDGKGGGNRQEASTAATIKTTMAQCILVIR